MVATTGNDRAVPVLPLGGFGSGPEVWEALQSVTPGLNWLPDGVPRGAWELTIPDMARAAVEQLIRSRIAPVDVIGVSFGGAIAQQMARDFPRVVRRVVLASTCVGGPWATPGSPFAVMQLMATSLRYAGSMGRVGVQDIICRSTAIGTWTSRFWVNQITQPTLVVHGDQDSLVPYANGVQLARLIPGAYLATILGADHYAVMTHAPEIGRVVSSFLAASLPAAIAQ